MNPISINITNWTIMVLVLFLESNFLIKLTAQSTPHNACSRNSDSIELIKFYEHFKGEDWTDHTNWLVGGQPINTWKGVKLNTQGCVESLILENNNLAGNLQDLKFEGIKVLRLSKNKIAGALLDFSSMPLLDTLYLNGNEISGDIPDLSKLPNLDLLDLSNNDLSGIIPDFSKLPNLYELFLSDNNLTGQVPNFSKLPNLNSLFLDGNKLVSPLPNFSNFPRLVNLYLGRNNFTGSVPVFTKLSFLWVMSLEGNKFSGKIPTFVNMPNLFFLNLSNCNLSGEIPDFNNPSLAIVSLRVNNLTGTIPKFTKAKLLLLIDFSNNQLTGSIPDFKDQEFLYYVSLNNNCFSGPMPNTPIIKEFDYDGNQFTFSDILNSGITSSLYIYSPQKSFFADTLIKAEKGNSFSIDLGIDKDLINNQYELYRIKGSQNILMHHQDSNKIVFINPQTSDAGRYIVKVKNPQLPLLTLSSKIISIKVCDPQKDSIELVKLYNETGGINWSNRENWLMPNKAIGTWYGIRTNDMGCIEKIDLSNNQLQGKLPVLDLNTLDTAIFENNLLSSNIPELNIPFIRVLNLSQNQMSGELPSVLSEWMDIQNLNLSKNVLTGGVPPDLGDLCELRTLRINDNKFNGELPEKLTLLTNLQIGEVDFGNNQIDSLVDKMVWFCPYGDSIFRSNPSYDRFLGICNIRCNGTEFNSLQDYSWMKDTIENLNCIISQCVLTEAQAGFVDVRGVKVFYTKTRCYTVLGAGTTSEYEDEVRFYDCGGHLLERVRISYKNEFNAEFGAMNLELYSQLVFDTKWQCGQSLNIQSGIKDDSSKENNNSIAFKMICSPNPSNYKAVCDLSNFYLSEAKVFLTNFLGQKCLIPYSLENSLLELNVGNLDNGMYIVSVWVNNQFYNSKIIVEH